LRESHKAHEHAPWTNMSEHVVIYILIIVFL